jgi:K+ transport systems, NAD-binding component
LEEPKKNLYIIVIGCGRVGSQLANRLSREGSSVVVIDMNPASFDSLTSDFSGFRLEGDATQVSVLREAKLGNADVLIAATDDDNINLMVAQIAKKVFGVHKVLARVFDPKRGSVYAQLGIETVCPTSLAVDLFYQAVSGKKGNDKE